MQTAHGPGMVQWSDSSVLNFRFKRTAQIWAEPHSQIKCSHTILKSTHGLKKWLNYWSLQGKGYQGQSGAALKPHHSSCGSSQAATKVVKLKEKRVEKEKKGRWKEDTLRKRRNEWSVVGLSVQSDRLHCYLVGLEGRGGKDKLYRNIFLQTGLLNSKQESGCSQLTWCQSTFNTEAEQFLCRQNTQEGQEAFSSPLNLFNLNINRWIYSSISTLSQSILHCAGLEISIIISAAEQVD